MRSKATALALLGLGVLAGGYVQHRWPIGNWRRDLATRPVPAAVSTADLLQIAPARRLILLCLGQSNAANYGETRRTAGPGVYVFFQNRWFQASDPLPGGDGYGGAIWTRVAARALASGKFDAVVLALVAKGSAPADDWLPGGACAESLDRTLQDLRSAGLPPTDILWQQGETEARNPTATARDYIAAVDEIAHRCRQSNPHATFFVARATAGPQVNEQIRQAQLALASRPGFSAGPDCDALGPEYRSDGQHFNDRGLDAAADLWWQILLSRQPRRG